MSIKLTSQALADAYAKAYIDRYPFVLGRGGYVNAEYIGGGWIELYGANLASHPALLDMYPNGWTLHAKVRSGKARAFIHQEITS